MEMLREKIFWHVYVRKIKLFSEFLVESEKTLKQFLTNRHLFKIIYRSVFQTFFRWPKKLVSTSIKIPKKALI